MRLRILLFLLLSCTAQAEISRNECPSFDHSARFPPLKDQDGHGLCWAFSASALLEEDLCLTDPDRCGRVSLSALDISRASWHLTEKSGEGSYIRDGVVHAMTDGGACEEEHAPFRKARSLGCLFQSISGGFGESCTHEKIKELYSDWRRKKRDSACLTDGSGPGANFEADIRKLTRRIGKLVSQDDELVRELPDLLRSAELDEQEFLKEVLIPPACRKNRIRLKALDPESVVESDVDSEDAILGRRQEKSSTDKLGIMKNAPFFRKRSVGLSICANRLGRGISTDGRCAGHAVVLTGMRWNEKKKRCEANLRNSWGKGAVFNGWVSADQVLDMTYRMTWIDRGRS